MARAVMTKLQIRAFRGISRTFFFLSLSSNFGTWATLQAEKRGHVWAAFARLHFNDWVHCCHQQRKPPASGNANARCWDASTQCHTQTDTHTRPYNNTHTQCHQNTAQTNRQEHTRTHTHTHTVVTTALQRGAQSDPLGTMVLFEWGQTMELFGIWIEPDDECPRRLNGRLQPPTHSLFWPWQYASVRRLLLWTKISVISMEAATH